VQKTNKKKKKLQWGRCTRERKESVRERNRENSTGQTSKGGGKYPQPFSDKGRGEKKLGRDQVGGLTQQRKPKSQKKGEGRVTLGGGGNLVRRREVGTPFSLAIPGEIAAQTRSKSKQIGQTIPQRDKRPVQVWERKHQRTVNVRNKGAKTQKKNEKRQPHGNDT